MESIKFWQIFTISVSWNHSRSKASINFVLVVQSCFRSQLFIIPQRVSIGFMSGELSGHGRTVTLTPVSRCDKVPDRVEKHHPRLEIWSISMAAFLMRWRWCTARCSSFFSSVTKAQDHWMENRPKTSYRAAWCVVPVLFHCNDEHIAWDLWPLDFRHAFISENDSALIFFCPVLHCLGPF
jgi:hypothetical protein